MCMRISSFICAFLIFACVDTGTVLQLFCVCLYIHVCFCMPVCAPRPEAVVGGERLDATGFSNPGDQLRQQQQQPPICLSNQASSPDSAKLRDHWVWRSPQKTHFLKLQLYAISQSNTSLLSNQQQHAPTTFYLREEGFWWESPLQHGCFELNASTTASF